MQIFEMAVCMESIKVSTAIWADEKILDRIGSSVSGRIRRTVRLR